MKKYPVLLFGLTILIAFVLIVIWEFALEDQVRGFYGHEAGETLGEKWNYVATVVSFIVLSLIAPTIILTKLETKRSIAEKSIKESEQKLRSLTEAAFDGVIVLFKELIVEADYAFAEMLGYETEEIINTSFLEFVAPESKELVKEKLLSRYDVSYQANGIKKDGTIFPVEIHNAVIESRDGNTVVIAMRDISDRIKHEEKMSFMAFHDVLTGLPNRRVLVDRLNQSILQAYRNNKYRALMYIDLDGFKKINDVHGHGIGDLYLKEVARRLKNVTRESDTVARIGGDEFVILLPSVSGNDGLETFANKVLAAFDKPFSMENLELDFALSMGTTLFPRANDSTEEVIKRADKAMYLSKSESKSTFNIANIT